MRNSYRNKAEFYEQRLDVHGSQPAFNEDGVDLSQIRGMLALTPMARLVMLQNWVNSLRKVRIIAGRVTWKS